MATAPQAVPLVATMSSANGPLQKCLQETADMTFGETPTVTSAILAWPGLGDEHRRKVIRETRAAAIRASGDMLLRHQITWQEDPFTCFQALPLPQELWVGLLVTPPARQT